MAYKSILTIASGDDLDTHVVDGAVALAQAYDGRVDGFAVGIDVSQPGYYYAGGHAVIEVVTQEQAEAEAKMLEAKLEEKLEGQSVMWAVERGVAQLGTVNLLVGSRSRFADLVVLGKPYDKGKDNAEAAILEAVLFSGGVPVLLLPEGTKVPVKPKRAVVAWNDSAEALEAIRAALPLLQAAELVSIVIIDPPKHAIDRSDPGGLLTQMLSRHGVRCEITVLAGTMPRTSDTLQRHISEIGADLLVMGAYGHSRLREALLGGATRNILEDATLPVIMKH